MLTRARTHIAHVSEAMNARSDAHENGATSAHDAHVNASTSGAARAGAYVHIGEPFTRPVANMLGTHGLTLPSLSPKECFNPSLSLSFLGLPYLLVLLHLQQFAY